MSPASAAMVEFNPGGNAARASSINTASTALGLALATIVGGALVHRDETHVTPAFSATLGPFVLRALER